MNMLHKNKIKKKIHRQLGWLGIVKNRWICIGDVWKNFPDLWTELIALRPMDGPTGQIFYMNIVEI
jgi:hypothetical protein